MSEVAVDIVDGPDKPEMLWSLAYPERQQRVQFKTANDLIEVVITRMDELADGFSFAVRGTVSSGKYQGKTFTGRYSVGDRAGELLVMN